ncbi:signal peptidase I [Enterococcus crotali]|uniref:signal peptidase I n=1 Tax=Enterococcus crotali TaxID=1453587 RepID=UPI000471A085|nr:signal peptidase I [Enterococcus crotali]OTP46490.1 signal peptidase I [Enterococcus termitis]OTP50622.1 signal peptidase I [Enterococcus termitis]
MVNKEKQTETKRPPRSYKSVKKNMYVKKVKKRRPIQKINSQRLPQRLWQSEALFLIAFVVVLTVFLFNFSVHRVSGQSMEPTFQEKDLILIKKKKSFRRYEIITFEPKGQKDDSYIKRVIGIPGDDIWVSGNNLFLLPNGSSQRSQNAPATIDELQDGMVKIALSPNAAEELKQYKKIPENHYFVQGDNRNHSNDSRSFGLINQDQIEGVVFYRYFPFNKLGIPY